jgi:ankyrin repeat protein
MLVRPGRHLVREGDVSVQVKGTLAALWNSSHKRTLFLFNDILIVASPSPAPASSIIESLVDLRAAKLFSFGQSFSGVASKGTVAFDIIHPGGTISIVAKTADEKECWVLTTFLTICDLMPAGTRAGAGLGWKHQILLGTMHSAVMTHDLTRAKELVAACSAGDLEYSAIEEMDHDGFTPLHYACMLRQWEMVRLLHGAGADVTLSERHGLTPMHLSALALDEHSLSLLVSNVFDSDLQDRDGRTPLSLACSDGQDVSGRPDPRLLRLCLTSLLALKADPDGCLLHPRLPLLTPLPVHFLASAWLADPLAALLDAGASVNAVCEATGGAALHAAAAALSLRPKRGLGFWLAAPPDQEERERAQEREQEQEQKQERGALSAAGAVDTFRVLLQRGARPNQRDLQGRTPLQIMGASEGLSAWAKSGCSPAQRSEVLALLLSFGARLDDSPSCQAIKSACTEVSCEAALDRWAAAPPARADALGLQLNALAPAGSGLASSAGGAGGGGDEGSGRSSGASSPTGSVGGSSAGPTCSLCGCGFTLFRRQHHCRVCNALCCDDCSRRRAVLAGADPQPHRCCDACFNVVLYRLECVRASQVARVNVSDAVVPRPRSAGKSGGGSPSASASAAPSLKGPVEAHAASRSELFSGSTAQPQAAAKGGGLAGTTATLAEVGDRLRERGHKLERLGDKSADMANAASDFARLAKQLNEQSRSNGFW